MNELLNKVYDEYNRYIYHLCLKLTRNQGEAEDLMQEVWVKVVRYEASVAEVDHVKAWLTTITMNTFCDSYRKNVRRSKYMMNQPEQLDVPILDLVPNNDISTEDMIEKTEITKIQPKKFLPARKAIAGQHLMFAVTATDIVCRNALKPALKKTKSGPMN